MNVNLLNIIPFTLSNLLLRPLTTEASSVNYFQNYEILAGQSICDLFITHPLRIQNAVSCHKFH